MYMHGCRKWSMTLWLVFNKLTCRTEEIFFRMQLIGVDIKRISNLYVMLATSSITLTLNKCPLDGVCMRLHSRTASILRSVVKLNGMAGKHMAGIWAKSTVFTNMRWSGTSYHAWLVTINVHRLSVVMGSSLGDWSGLYTDLLLETYCSSA